MVQTRWSSLKSHQLNFLEKHQRHTFWASNRCQNEKQRWPTAPWANQQRNHSAVSGLSKWSKAESKITNFKASTGQQKDVQSATQTRKALQRWRHGSHKAHTIWRRSQTPTMSRKSATQTVQKFLQPVLNISSHGLPTMTTTKHSRRMFDQNGRMWEWYYENHPNNPDLDNENDEQ